MTRVGRWLAKVDQRNRLQRRSRLDALLVEGPVWRRLLVFVAFATSVALLYTGFGDLLSTDSGFRDALPRGVLFAVALSLAAVAGAWRRQARNEEHGRSR